MFKTSLSPNVNSRAAWGNVMRPRFKYRVQGRQVLEHRGTAFIVPPTSTQGPRYISQGYNYES